MTSKITLSGPATATPPRDTLDAAFSNAVDFGAPAGQRKHLFQFATKPRRKSLGPSRSEFGCD